MLDEGWVAKGSALREICDAQGVAASKGGRGCDPGGASCPVRPCHADPKYAHSTVGVMAFFLLLIAYGLVWIVPALFQWLCRCRDGRAAADEVPPPQALQLLKLLVGAHGVSMSVAAVSAYLSGEYFELVVAAVLLVLSLAVLGSFWWTPSPVGARGRAFVAAAGVAAWPALLFAKDAALPHLLGVLAAHGLAAFVTAMLRCPPWHGVALTLGAVVAPAFLSLGGAPPPDALWPMPKALTVLVLPVLLLGGGACHYVRCLHRRLESQSAEERAVRDDLAYCRTCIRLAKDAKADAVPDDLLEAMLALRAPASTPPSPGGGGGDPGAASAAPGSPPHSVFNLAELLGAVVEQAERAAPGLCVVLHSTVAETDMVAGHKHRVRQALAILIGNAVRARRAGTVMLSADCAVAPRGATGPVAAQLQLRVTEAGAVVPRQEVEALVGAVNSPFPNTAAGEEATTLWVCSRLVGAMGGTVEITSTETDEDPAFDVALELPCCWHPPSPEKWASMSSLNLGTVLEISAYSHSGSFRSWGSQEVPRCPLKRGEIASALLRLTQCSVALAKPTASSTAPRCSGSPPESPTTRTSLSPIPSPFLEARGLAAEGRRARNASRRSLSRTATLDVIIEESDTVSRSSTATAEAVPPRDSLSPEPARPAGAGHRMPRLRMQSSLSSSAVVALWKRSTSNPQCRVRRSGEDLMSHSQSVPAGLASSAPHAHAAGPGAGAGEFAPSPGADTAAPGDHPCSIPPSARIQWLPLGEDAGAGTAGPDLEERRSSQAQLLRREEAAAGAPTPDTGPSAPGPYVEDVSFLSRVQPEVLVVSSDLMRLKGMRAVFRALGITLIRVAVIATTAVETFKRHPGIAVVILDQGDGRLAQRMELAQQLRQLSGDRRLLVVALAQALDGRLLREVSRWDPGLVDQWLAHPLSVRRLGQIIRAFFTSDADADPGLGMRDPLEAVLLGSVPQRPDSTARAAGVLPRTPTPR